MPHRASGSAVPAVLTDTKRLRKVNHVVEKVDTQMVEALTRLSPKSRGEVRDLIQAEAMSEWADPTGLPSGRNQLLAKRLAALSRALLEGKLPDTDAVAVLFSVSPRTAAQVRGHAEQLLPHSEVASVLPPPELWTAEGREALKSALMEPAADPNNAGRVLMECDNDAQADRRKKVISFLLRRDAELFSRPAVDRSLSRPVVRLTTDARDAVLRQLESHPNG